MNEEVLYFSKPLQDISPITNLSTKSVGRQGKKFSLNIDEIEES